MSTPTNAVPETQVVATPAVVATRPLYWSVRRELWENRSIYFGPMAVAGVILFGFFVSTMRYGHRVRENAALDPAQQRHMMLMPYDAAAALLIATAFLVGLFYCLDALYGERRDRSILFWKSLPVSDLTTVLAKASIPLAVLPVVTFAMIVVTHIVILLLSVTVLGANGLNATTSTKVPPLFEVWLALLYSLAAIALWHAPIYAWLLLVSSWAKRATLLWAVLPPLGICVFEKIAFNSEHLGKLLLYRFVGWFWQAYDQQLPGLAPEHPLMKLTPGKLLSTPGLWLGLIVAAGFLAGAARMRRNREPI